MVKRVMRKSGERFYEGRILQKLHHPNVVKLRAQMEDGKYYYLVMEYCDGVTLKEYIQKEEISFRQIVSWGLDLCDVLTFLHHQRPAVIHRDIKPSNIMVTRQKRLKLIDFGIARWSYQKDTKAYGTRNYAAPEQFRGEYSEKSDVYNLGAALNWCWKGKSSWYWKYLIRKTMDRNPNRRYTPKQLKRRLKWLYFWL